MGAFEQVGPALEALRKKRGIEPGQMLALLRLKAYSSLSRLEAKNANPQARKIARYLDAIGASVHDLAAALEPATDLPRLTLEDVRARYPEATPRQLLDVRTAIAQMETAEIALRKALIELEELTPDDGPPPVAGNSNPGPRRA